jgi:hypothetical protein
LSNFSSREGLDVELETRLREAGGKISEVAQADDFLQLFSNDLAMVQEFFYILNAIKDVPYGTIYFSTIDHTQKIYKYDLQIDEPNAFKKLAGNDLINTSIS